MAKRLTPASIRPPFANYAHAVEVPAGHRLLVASGQLGIDPDERIPEDAEAQAEICFRNVGAILAEAGMGPADVVRINAFVVGRENMAGYMAARDRFVTDPPPASTLLLVSGFTREAFKVEVEVLASAP